MIYIFEDRYERKEANMSLINRYKWLITFADIKCDSLDQLEVFISTTLKTPSLILLHDSYRYPGDKLRKEQVISKFLEHDIPVVLFSGGILKPNESLINERLTYNINSLVMYKNLEIYLQKIDSNKKTPIDILLWGESYMRNKIVIAKSSIFRVLCKLDPTSLLNEDIIENIEEIIKDKLEGEGLETIRQRFLNALSSPITCQAFMDSINSI